LVIVDSNFALQKLFYTQVLSDLNEVKAELIRKLSEVSQQKASATRLLTELDSLKEKHLKEKEQLVEQHTASLQRSLEEAELKWSEVSWLEDIEM